MVLSSRGVRFDGRPRVSLGWNLKIPSTASEDEPNAIVGRGVVRVNEERIVLRICYIWLESHERIEVTWSVVLNRERETSYDLESIEQLND